MVMVLTIDDTGSKTKLTITNGSKTLFRKTGSIKGLLKMIHSGTKKDKVRKSIEELRVVYPFMVDSKTIIQIKET